MHRVRRVHSICVLIDINRNSDHGTTFFFCKSLGKTCYGNARATIIELDFLAVFFFFFFLPSFLNGGHKD
jgi:hypothetical protein